MKVSPFITKVTVTGADDGTDLTDLLAISKDFPFVEFGILLSRRQSGHPRFPGRAWLRSLVEADTTANLSGHICGSWVREILMGKWPEEEFAAIHPDLAWTFDRYQLNTHAEPHEHDAEGLQGIVDRLNEVSQRVIIQNDGVNTGLLGIKGIQALFDLSHGAGILPAEWPSILEGVKCGYAGGLSPENVVPQIESIASAAGGREVWIDAETHLRSERTDAFDLKKVRAFLLAAEPYVVRV